MNAWQRTFMITGTLILTVAALYWTRSILVPVVLAVFLTFILVPLVSWLQRRGLSRLLAVPVVVTAALVVLGGVLAMVMVELTNLALALPEYKHEISRKIVAFREGVRGSWLDRVGEAFKEVADKVNEAQPAGAEPMPVTVTPSSWSFILSAGPILDLVVTAGLVIILVVFMLLRREDLRNRLIRLSGERNLTRLTKALDDAGESISRFLLMQFVINSAYGLILGVGLFGLGVPYGVLWGFLAAVLRYIPYLGPWIGMLFPLAMSIAVMPGWMTPVLVISFVAVVELITSNLLEPILYRRSLGISEVALLISAAFWTWLWGPIGLVLSTPLTACLVVFGRFVPWLSVFTVLLGDEPPLDPEVGYYQRLLAKDQDEAIALVEEGMKEKSVDDVFDHMLLPALVRTRQNEQGGELTDVDAAFIYRVTAELLDDLQSTREFARAAQDVSQPNDWPERGSRGIVAGWSSENEAEKLALRMLGELLDADGVELKVLSAAMTFAEIASKIDKDELAAICLVNVSPGALTPVRSLCRKLRGHFPHLRIIIAALGRQQNLTEIEAGLSSAGENGPVTSLNACREQVLKSLPQLAVHA